MAPNTTDRTLVAVVVLLLVLPTFAMGFRMLGFGPTMGGYWGDRTGFGGWMLVVVVTQFLFLAVLVGAGYLLYRAATGSDGGDERALEELRLAYARGDLSDEEFESRRERLERRN
ncbi:SHOCT domain-containing protein [Haloarchaeobius sp. HRN-SO-5]|uniref:SHOCT domain-containing protein n=1 Tax=Haloarchaeobius sp. HRN-SO-5 TaxID=3446118 RepID=UPI003EB834E3